MMSRLLLTTTVVLTIVVAPAFAAAHCDAVSGPVATSAMRALETGNVNLALPYVPATAEPQVKAAYEQAVIVRTKGPEARALADRYFMETVVRLHREGEHAPFTGLKPAGTDFGPAIPAAEQALETGTLDAVLALLDEELVHALKARFHHVMHEPAAAPKTDADVPAARKRVTAELEFVTFVETLYRATRGEGHGHQD
jgi:hypothetical protein